MDLSADFERALDERDLSGILQEMRRRPGEIEVQQAASDAIFRCVQHNPSAAKEAVALGGLQDLSGAIKGNVGHRDLCTEACTALWRLCREGGFAVAQAAIQQGCFEALKSVLDAHPEGSAPNEAALLALGCLADHGMVSFGGKDQVQEMGTKKQKGKATALIRIIPEQGF
ncbi:unnamed protein product [Cladocopium goreaui]|uniref:Uncharacterized protein n=1 Tax=Cladocopium goreaui TaxID=2562237 RepID=A0A9P1DJ58_9DINO|nr:unnamed protein product [Cladocopium goreaui]|mmetsp:Transcript_35232/g.76119  ORF Transcript_35232/g.76119 Transcript_35232/m.76119 type:complete len:171 (-) Transcript_35232:90-602(-)